jgi:hypothetical protein
MTSSRLFATLLNPFYLGLTTVNYIVLYSFLSYISSLNIQLRIMFGLRRVFCVTPHSEVFKDNEDEENRILAHNEYPINYIN